MAGHSCSTDAVTAAMALASAANALQEPPPTVSVSWNVVRYWIACPGTGMLTLVVGTLNGDVASAAYVPATKSPSSAKSPVPILEGMSIHTVPLLVAIKATTSNDISTNPEL